MKAFDLLLILLILSLHLNAQQQQGNIDVLWGPTHVIPTSYEIPDIFGHDSSGYYTLSYDYRFAIEHYDGNLEPAGKEYIDLFKSFRTRKLVALVHFHNVLYLFTSEMHLQSMLLFVETINKETLLQNNDEKLVMEVPNLVGWMADFGVLLSRLENKMLVYSRIIVFRQKFQDFRFRLYGEGMSLEWERHERVEHERILRHESLFVPDDSGNVYLLGKLYEPRLIDIFKPQKNKYHILAITENGQRSETYEINYPGKYIHGINIEPGNNLDLVCAGFYSPRYNYQTMSGIFFFTIDGDTKQVKNRKFHEFQPYLIEESMNLKEGTGPDNLIAFELNALVLRKNGKYIMTAEQQYDQDYDNYNNIIVFCLEPDGNIAWERIIRKRQSQRENGKHNYSSYALLAPMDRTRIEIVYNENHKNLKHHKKPKLYSFSNNEKAYLASVEIGEFGEMAQNNVYYKKKKRMVTPLPLYYYDMKNNEMVIPALRYRKCKFLKLTYH